MIDVMPGAKLWCYQQLDGVTTKPNEIVVVRSLGSRTIISHSNREFTVNTGTLSASGPQAAPVEQHGADAATTKKRGVRAVKKSATASRPEKKRAVKKSPKNGEKITARK